MDWNNWQEIINWRDEEVSNLAGNYPENLTGSKPKPKQDNESNQSYGKKLDKYEAKKNVWKEKVRERNKIIAEIDYKMKIEIFKYFDVENNPKADTAWSMAWENGHSGGYSDVISCFENLVELIS